MLETGKLIRQGKIFSLGRLYEHGMPLPGKRHFSLTIPGSPTHPPAGKNQGVFFDEMFSGEIGQVGTQFDGLGHAGVRIISKTSICRDWPPRRFTSLPSYSAPCG